MQYTQPQDPLSPPSPEIIALGKGGLDIESIILAWLRPNRAIEFSALDQGLCLEFYEGSSNVGVLTVSLKDITARYGLIETVDAAHTPPPPGGLVPGFSSCSEEWYEKLESTITFEWNDELCSEMVNIKDAVVLILPHALSQNGSARIEYRVGRDPEFPMPDVTLDLAYSHRESGAGWGSSFGISLAQDD